MNEIKIGTRVINSKSPVYTIAEAGVNHNGDLNVALDLVRQASEIGVDCIKFQTFKANKVVTKNAPKANYQLEVTDKEESQLEMLQKLELDFSSYKEIISLCNKLSIDFLSTPYNHDDADFLNNLEVPAFKIASGQLVEFSFLKYVAKFNKPMIISTGMANFSEVFEAVEAIKSVGNDQIVVLQCTTNYPSKIEDSNIRSMNSMGESLDILMGYSDHVPNNYACYSAVARGARVIEKHFTLDKSMEGPDHSSSLDVSEFRELIHGIKQVELSLGSKIKSPSQAEVDNTFGMRRSIVANRTLEKGTVISQEFLDFKRPANGLAPKYLDQLIGKSVARQINEDEPLTYDSIQW